MRVWRWAGALAVVVVSVCGCSRSEPGSGADADASPAGGGELDAGEIGEGSAAEPDEVESVDTDGANPFGGNDPEDGLMPDVMCMSLQQAQDEIQDHGVFLSRSTDLSGEDRMQINDSNWVVLAQEPAAGTAIGEGEAVLGVVKFGEPGSERC